MSNHTSLNFFNKIIERTSSLEEFYVEGSMWWRVECCFQFNAAW